MTMFRSAVVMMAAAVAFAAVPVAAEAPAHFGVSASFTTDQERGVVSCALEVTDLGSGAVLLSPRLQSQPGREATAEAVLEVAGVTYEFSCSCTVSGQAASYTVSAREGEHPVFMGRGTMALDGLCPEAGTDE